MRKVRKVRVGASWWAYRESVVSSTRLEIEWLCCDDRVRVWCRFVDTYHGAGSYLIGAKGETPEEQWHEEHDEFCVFGVGGTEGEGVARAVHGRGVEEGKADHR